MEEATRRSYQFWDTQPVPKLGIDHLSNCAHSSFIIILVPWSNVSFFLSRSVHFHLYNICFLETHDLWHSVFWVWHLFVRLFAGETVTSHGSIEPDKDNIREEPYSLPQGFSWDALDLGNAAVVQHSNHYIYPSNSYTYKYTPGNNSFKAFFHFFFSLWSWKSCTLSSMRTTWRMMTTCFVSITLLNFCFGKNDWLESLKDRFKVMKNLI